VLDEQAEIRPTSRNLHLLTRSLLSLNLMTTASLLLSPPLHPTLVINTLEDCEDRLLNHLLSYTNREVIVVARTQEVLSEVSPC
jgi:isochorismate hydrolase